MNEKGFTLLEVLVAMLVGGMIMAAIVSGIFQISFGTGQISERNTALADIDNAAHWLTRDVVMGQSTDLWEGAPPTSNMTITWTDFTSFEGGEESISHSANYTYSGTELRRNCDGVVTIIGRHLTNVEFSIDNRLVTLTLTSSTEKVPRTTVTRKYLLQMRAESGN